MESGRATRRRDGDGEVWSFGAEDEALAARLVALGASGIGGFTLWGTEAGGVWARRDVPVRTAADLAREPMAWRDALAIVRAIARALDACETSRTWPGELAPSQIALAPRVFLVADALVLGLTGARGSRSAAGARWTPPEQAAGEPWGPAANRYVLGLVAYRLIAGAHPFEGAGLRQAIAEQAAGAPPFEASIARESFQPGVQSFVLSMLRGDAHARPRDAAEIVARCDALLGAKNAEIAEIAHPLPVASTREASPRRDPRARSSGQKRRAPRMPRALLVVPSAIGALAVVAAFARTTVGDPRDEAPMVRPLEPLTSTRPAACAPCHAREVAEWERSAMSQSVKSPLFGALESAIEEQVGRDARCPNGAGILRKAGPDACFAEESGITVTGSGGEHWCVSCHAPGENVRAAMPPWTARGTKRDRAPVRDLAASAAMDGIACAICHQTIGPVGLHARTAGRYEGNPTWRSIATGETFLARPEDRDGRPGIANSGYLLDPAIFLGGSAIAAGEPIVHRRAPPATARYLASSESCGACHDVRLFGTDAIGVERGEHFKRLRNAYSEWRAWASDEARAGRSAATCQGCHMSDYPGVCVAGGGGASDPCPSGTHFEARPPRTTPDGIRHSFTSVDIPLGDTFPDAFADDPGIDARGVPVGLRARRDLLLARTFRFAMDARRVGDALEVPLTIENTGAGHRVPAGFSQEREIWVGFRVTDARGGVVYEVGRVRARDEDLRDKIFTRVNVSDALVDAKGRPLGVFGADVVDGPDVPAWSPDPARGGTTFRGRGLVNLQNGFLRCVRCIGIIDRDGKCQPGPGQGRTRADRFDDGAYDPDSGACRSNLRDGNELFETYFPIGALDAERGVVRGPDAIIDTRSAPPNVPLRYTYAIDARGHAPPFRVEATLHFRAFPPYLVRAFAAYEAQQEAAGARPSGAQVTERMLRRLDIVDLARAEARVP